jgi:prokaryotic ubiquitin-like protein Pup
MIHKTRQATRSASEETTGQNPENIQNDELTEDVDGLLDEIDDLLEPNAEAFVKQYQQKGGE